LVLGIDGYIGWALSMHVAKRGHVVSGVDNFSRRSNVESVKPAARGEYRVFNQLDEVYSIGELAEIVLTVAKKIGIDPEIKNVENPRTEKAEHYYKVDHENLRKLGFKPTRKIQETVEIMLKDLGKHKDRIQEKKEAILPKTRWYADFAKHIAEPTSPTIKQGRDGDLINLETEKWKCQM
jgi:nucleoside-diphosphate-sugar epimerase